MNERVTHSITPEGRLVTFHLSHCETNSIVRSMEIRFVPRTVSAVLRRAIAVGCALVVGPACAQTPSLATLPNPQAARRPIDSAELARFVDPLFTAQMEKEHIPGAVFVLVQNGRVLYQRGYGFANIATRTPVNPEKTIWRIGSISKVF